jgi:hypothetical protein
MAAREVDMTRKRWALALVVPLALGALAVRRSTPARAADGRTPLPQPRAWEFLDASSQIVTSTAHSGFRGALEGDLDNDGDLDVVVVQNVTDQGVVGTPAPSVLYMNEDGRFVDRTSQYLPEILVPQVTWWVNIHDFDSPGDGWRDIFIPGGQGARSRLYRNRGRDGQGVFLGFEDVSSRINGPLATATHCYHSHKGDFDRDGAQDVLVYQYRPDLGFGQNRLLMNRGGLLVDETAERLPTRSEPGIFGHTEDLNGDGWIDISQVNLKNGLVPGVPSSVPSIRVLINDGTGHFPLALEQQMPERINPLSGFGTYSLEHADVNGDGWLDIYVINWGIPGNEARDGILVNSRNPQQLFPASGIYFPEFPISSRDSDGDHPVSRDLNGDGRVDMVVAQFATRPFILMNETTNGVLRMVERTPPEVPTTEGFRTKAFDANGDGQDDVWLAMRGRNYLLIGHRPEIEPNDSIVGANRLTTFPALRTGAIGGARELLSLTDTDVVRDLDYYGLPSRALAEGARIRLRPAADTDLKLALLDSAGAVLAVSENAGAGVMEEIVTAAGSPGTTIRVDRQAGQGAGTYRVEVAPVSGLKTAAEPPRPRGRSR